MASIKSNEEYITDWAYKEDFTNTVHISQAESGLNGYYCLGCKKEMQAVKGQIREHYFRHHAKDVKWNETECVRANKEYRERVARDILQRLKKLKVPAVYKYPPRGSDGLSNKLAESKWIEATKVKSELTFYEDENCEIQYGSNPDIDERFMPIRPDITFFDASDKPILFVEFVITHKIDLQKKNKLQRYGINTVQIIIPKKSEEDIERVLKSSKSIKWVYNEIEANTEYVYLPDTSGRGVWEIDDDQRKLFEESYKCRKVQIDNFVRSVRGALDSESYKRAELNFEQEISRIKEATERSRSRLERLEIGHGEEVFSGFRAEYEKLQQREGKLRIEQKEFKSKYSNLEERYLAKAGELTKDQEQVGNYKREGFDNIGRYQQIKEERMESLKLIQQEKDGLDEFFGKLESEEQGSFESRKLGTEERLREFFRAEEKSLSESIRQEEENIRILQERRDALQSRFAKLEEKEQADFGEETRRITDEEEKLQRTIREEVDREAKDPTSELPREFKNLLEAERVGRDFIKLQDQETYYKRARDFFNTGAWKTR